MSNQNQNQLFCIYNPVPTRAWSRVQDSCSQQAYNSTVPNSGIPPFDPAAKQMQHKGNVLQNKANSSCLTKSQVYSKIAKGMWVNRTKTWATQSQTYTNPNTNNLLRIYTKTTTLTNPNTNPNIYSGCGGNLSIIPDGGSLVGNTTVNPCTGDIVSVTHTLNTSFTSSCDVPGPIETLYYNKGYMAPSYARKRYIMNTSGNKFPQGYKGFVSAVQFPNPSPNVVVHN
jgi:hypothetical protein